MAGEVIGKIWVDGARALVLAVPDSWPPRIRWYAMRTSKIPVGMSFVDAGKGWGTFTVETES